MIGFRKALALTGLGFLAYLAVTSSVEAPPLTPATAAWGVRLLVLPLAVVMLGVVKGWYWSRWLGLSCAFAVLPWALVLMSVPSFGVSRLPQLLALAGALLLLAALPGRAMFEAFEGRSEGLRWSGRRMAWTRWAIILNAASVMTLYAFVVAYRYRVEWHFVLFAVLLGGMVAGTTALARQKTAGLLILATCVVALLPTSIYFAIREAAGVGEAVFFFLLFLPGIVAALGTLAAFAGPLRRFFESA